MSITVYGIANCDSVKKTRKQLEAQQLDYDFVDFKKTPPSSGQLKNWITQFGADTIINKRGTTWRKLDEASKALAESSIQDQIKLLSNNTSMIKRPIIETPSQTMIGFDEQAIAKLAK